MPIAAGLYYFLHDSGDYSKPPVLLIHGAGGNYLNWPPEVRRLARARVVALDLSGHGKSGGIGWQSIPDYARNVVKFMDDAGLRRAMVVGHSMGGAIALEMALKYKERVAGLGLIATGARLPIPSPILSDAASQTTVPLAIQAMLALFFGPEASPGAKQVIAEQLAVTRLPVLYGDLLACNAFDVTRRLRYIRAPVLVVCGTEDRLTPLRYSQTLAAKIPSAALQTLDGAGHMVMLEQPRRLAGLLSVFMSTIPYIPGGK